MKEAYVDLSFRVGEIDERVIKLLKDMRYKAVAIEGLSKSSRKGSLILLPRITYRPSIKLDKLDSLLILKAKNHNDLKFPPYLAKKAIAVEISGSLLRGLSDKDLNKIKNLSLSLLINGVDLYRYLASGQSLEGIMKLINEFIKGNVSLAVGSGATMLKELKHPVVYVGLLVELGVPEVKAYESVFDEPKRVARRGGYSV